VPSKYITKILLGFCVGYKLSAFQIHYKNSTRFLCKGSFFSKDLFSLLGAMKYFTQGRTLGKRTSFQVIYNCCCHSFFKLVNKVSKFIPYNIVDKPKLPIEL
jgi:hypothetical protein